MRNLKKFKERSKGDKIFRIINLTFAFLQCAAAVGLLIWNIVRGDPDNRILSCVGVAIAAVLPIVFELVFGSNLPPIMFFGIEVYLAIAGIWGSALNGYYLFEHLDTIVHTIMGYLVAMLGIFLIARLGEYKKFSPWLVVMFCVFFSLAVELVWEVAEFTCDNVAGQTAQGLPPEGFTVPLVTDTMIDIVCNLGGSLAFALHFILGKSLPKSLGIRQIEHQLAKEQECRRFVQIKEKTELKEQTKENSEEKRE